MATIQSAKEKYRARTADGAAKYNAAKGRMSANYASGVAKFLGTAPGPQTTAAYQAGINRAQYSGGDADKWERRYREAMSR